MALVFMDGFDIRNDSSVLSWQWTENSSTKSFITGALGVGGALQLNRYSNGGGAYYSFYRYFPSTYTELILGVRYQNNSAAPNTGRSYVQFLTSGGSSIASISFGALGVPTIRNTAGSIVATGFTKVAGMGWHYLEWRIKINGASGECQMFCNGVEEIATTVANFGSTNIGGLLFSSINDDNVNYHYIDDLYVLDTSGGAPLNTFLGDCRIETLVPTSDGANTAWAPNSGGTEYTQIDEGVAGANDGDATYISASIPGDISTFGHSDLSFVTGTVYAVQFTTAARKDDAGLRQIRPIIRQGGVNYPVGAVQTLSASYVVKTDLLPLDPVSATWTAANVNANEYGVSLVT